MGEVNINKEIFDINDLIRKTVTKFENKIQRINIDMNISFYDEFNLVIGYYEKIERVIYNLIDNAIKFTEKGEKIKIETWINDDKIYISVKDRGRDISEKDQTIVKEFIKAHYEKIIVNSKEGRGSEFIFTLHIYK